MTNSIAIWTKEWADRSGIECWYAEEIESTNSVAKTEVGIGGRSHLAPMLFVAGHQTAGRGRGSNSWTNTSGALLSSWSFHAQKAPQPILAPLAGLSVYRSCMKVWPHLNWSMKAPNDIYLGDKKVAGLLIETVQAGNEQRVIIGLGFNAFSSPPEVTTATSLADALGGKDKLTHHNWESFLQSILLSFISTLSAGQNQSLIAKDAGDIQEALNRRPNLESKIEKVGPQGELYTAGGKINWQDL
jgi:BirA family biotin operon repressor/biotin-[acetyl-CoA-carboxylase] ligase